MLVVRGDEAFEFFKPVEDDVDLAGLAAFYSLDHQELLSVWGDIVVLKKIRIY